MCRREKIVSMYLVKLDLIVCKYTTHIDVISRRKRLRIGHPKLLGCKGYNHMAFLG